jgi:D-glycero-D-manno-heptose 1,7-bisphosphate phosphatase
MKPAVFFDRDNTLIINDQYEVRPDSIKLMPGAADAIARVKAAGYAVVVVTNQSGVAKGLCTEADVEAANAAIAQLLRRENPQAVIDLWLYCPYHPQATVEKYRQDSDLRKPRPGMLFRAASQLHLDLSASWLVGDARRDVAAGKAAGCRTIFFTPPEVQRSPAADEALAEDGSNRADHEAATLSGAADIVLALRQRSREDASEGVLKQILTELKSRRSHTRHDFSITRLLAGILQVLALGAAAIATLPGTMDRVYWLLLAMVLQGAVTSLLLFKRD